MASQEDVENALRERLADPTINGDLFDEFKRRLDAIKSE